MKSSYTADELVEMLRQKQGNLTLKEFAAEIQISFQMLSDVYRGTRSVGNENILKRLAPKGKKFVHRDQYDLVSD